LKKNIKTAKKIMIDPHLLRENPEKIKQSCQKRGIKIEIEKILKLDEEKRKLQKEIDSLRHQKKLASLKKAKEIKEILKRKEEEFKKISEAFLKALSKIPNLLLDEVPYGIDETQNVVEEIIGKKPKFNFPPKSYLELNKTLDWIDIKRAGKVSGTRFGYLKNQAVFLEIALLNYVFKNLTSEKFLKKIIKKNKLKISPIPFIPILPPVLIRPEMMQKMGYLDAFSEDFYFTEKDNLILVGTAEQSIGPMHADEIFLEKDLPKRYLGFSTCFRREAGSWGKDTKGIFRVHQFDKIEMFSFCKEEDSKEEHRLFLEIQKELMKGLGLYFQVVRICSGDIGFCAASQFDLETWIPSENRFRETHSTSNCTDFQTRRLNIRYKTKQNQLKFVHTVNGTAFAIGRILIAIMEQFQTREGKVRIPKSLKFEN